MKNLLLLLGLFTHSLLLGQTHSFGVDVGITYSTINRVNYDYYEHVEGYATSTHYWYSNGNFISKTSVGLYNNGFSQKVILVDTVGNVLADGVKERTRMTYFGATQIFGVTIGQRVYGYTGIGASFNKYFRTVVTLPDGQLDDGSNFNGYKYIYSNLQPLDVTGVVEVGIGFRRDNGPDICLMLNHYHGLKNISYLDVTTESPWKTRSTSLRVGVRYNLPSRKGS